MEERKSEKFVTEQHDRFLHFMLTILLNIWAGYLKVIGSNPGEGDLWNLEFLSSLTTTVPLRKALNANIALGDCLYCKRTVWSSGQKGIC